MNELASQTLAQIVTGNHRTASVFEKYHLDFCCKGKRSLEKACADQNISVDELLAELESAAHTNQSNFPFDKLSLSQLAEYIVANHHAYVKKESPQLLAYAEKVTFKHGEHHPELNKILKAVTTIKEEMEQHMHKEETVLFPRIQELEKFSKDEHRDTKLNVSYLQASITLMVQEHDQAGLLQAEIRQLSNNYTPPQDACTTYKLLFAGLEAFEADLHQHVHLENNILFPKSIELFSNITAAECN